MGRFLTSKDLAKLLGISPATVRRWASAGLLPAERTPGGHRRFPLDVAERLAVSAELRQVGVEQWVSALVRPREPLEVDSLLMRARSVSQGWWAVAETLGRVLTDLGARWQAGHLTVIEEHIASSRLSRALNRIVDTLPARNGAPAALLATPEGEAHTLGLSLAELTIREWGWRTVWVGAGTPTELLAARVELGQTDALVLSASVFSSGGDLSRAWGRLATACMRAGTALIAGGRGPWPTEAGGGKVITTFDGLRNWLATVDARSLEQARADALGTPRPSAASLPVPTAQEQLVEDEHGEQRDE
jgi:excisionase family DNA binding protein